MKYQFALIPALALSASILAIGSTSAPVQAPTVQFPQASPAALVREQVGLTTVEVEYSRPGVKGRKIFGGLVPYDEVWRTGANAATKVTFSTDVNFGGKQVAAGSYGLFTIPGKREWTVILNKITEQWGSYSYDESNDLVRVKAAPQTLGEPVETMSIALHGIRDNAANFAISWEATRVSIPIQTNLVEVLVPQIKAAMAGDGNQKPYLASAMFYYEHDVDLMQAIEWIDVALEAQPEAVWILYRKGLILSKLGEHEAAIDTANQTIDQAKKLGGELGSEYTRLGEELINRSGS